MVALNEQFTLKNPSLGSNNRVGDFFCGAEPGVGENRLASRIGTKEKTTYSYETASGLPVWSNRDPIAERGGLNLYSMVGNDVVNQWDLWGLSAEAEFKIVTKSFINGVGSVGDFGWYNPGQNLRLLAFAAFASTLDAFNQNPDTDIKDGEYRLFSETNLKVCCNDNSIASFSYELGEEGGAELSIIDGTINFSLMNFDFDSSSVSFSWRTWGRPNNLAEPGMQAVRPRISRNIWNEGNVEMSCVNGSPELSVDGFSGSAYPSHRLWIDGEREGFIGQGDLSNLWYSRSGMPTFVR